MPFVLSDASLPITVGEQPKTDDDFSQLCGDHSDLMFEMTEESKVIVMARALS